MVITGSLHRRRPKPNIFTFMSGLLKFFAAFRLSRKIMTDREILDLKIAAVAKFIAKALSWTQRSYCLLCNILLSYLWHQLSQKETILPVSKVSLCDKTKHRNDRNRYGTQTVYRKTAIIRKLRRLKRRFFLAVFRLAVNFFGSFTSTAVKIRFGG